MTRRSSRRARRTVADAASNPAGYQPPAAKSEPTPPPTPLRSQSSRGSARRGSSRGAEAEAPVRRSSRSRRRSSSTTDATESGGRRPPISSDGKASISCPSCAARYKIAEENLETKVTCTQCQRTFFPLAAANTRHAAPDHTKPIIAGVVAIIAVIVVGVIINQMSKPAPPGPPRVVEKPPVNLGSTTEEVVAVIAWGVAIGDKDTFNAGSYSDMDAIQKKFDIDTKSLHSRSFGDAKKLLTDRILTRLFEADETLVFRAYRPKYGRIREKKMVADKRGTVRLRLEPRDSKITKETAIVNVSYAFDPEDRRFKVSNWWVESMARVDYLLEKVDDKNPGNKHVAHTIIGKTEYRKIIFDGKELEITEAKLVPLPHLDSTSPEDRKKIDALISRMIDLNLSGIVFNQASNELETYQKAAVPRVLNKMYETKMKSRDDIDVMNRLCRFLRHLTGERFAFNHVDMAEGTDLGGTEKERISSLKQWYAWWARYHDRDTWQNIDSDDEVELLSHEILALRKKKEEAARAEREARRKRARGRK